jgi:hypothetical protein
MENGDVVSVYGCIIKKTDDQKKTVYQTRVYRNLTLTYSEAFEDIQSAKDKVKVMTGLIITDKDIVS